jgi:cell division protein FtsA
LINIGSSTTSLAVFEEGELLHTAILPIGSEHITSDVAIGLRCPINLAERIKIEYGSANSEKFGKKDEVDISEMAREENSEEDSRVVSQKYISEIIEARVEEIFKKVDDELKKVDRSGMLPAGVFLVGAGTKLNDIVDVAKKELRLPACIAVNKSILTVIEKVNEQNYLTALGLVAWGNQFLDDGNSRGVAIKKTFDGMVKNIRDIFSKFKP